jgi:hypothetical protein
MRLLPVDGRTDNWDTELNRADNVAGFMIGSALAFVSGLHSISIPRNIDRYRKAYSMPIRSAFLLWSALLIVPALAEDPTCKHTTDINGKPYLSCKGIRPEAGLTTGGRLLPVQPPQAQAYMPPAPPPMFGWLGLPPPRSWVVYGPTGYVVHNGTSARAVRTSP